ncbi:PREDICTED: uncharacterized protein LOC108358754 [Rhagoletis zephyria]|uniref:uncharacterized protein LOC108358754 n=1 Tax=Rhagoletis zephyria TaxID=28612 RepID=UPI000811365E|nr:PREDICTED: uncharacterized protein LOC108358754 [Rhagoletis zephyria]
MEKNFMLENLNSEIAAMKDSNKNDMEVLKNVLSEQVVLLKKVAQDLFPSDKYSAIFPITIQHDLDDVEDSITAESHDQMISSVFNLIKSGGLKSNIRSIFAEKIVMNYNFEGRQRKKSLKAYPKLMDILFRASQKLGKDQKEFEADLKFGLKAVKNKYHKANTLRRKLQHNKNNEKEETEEDEENEESYSSE